MSATEKAYEKLRLQVPITIALSSSAAMFLGAFPLMPVEAAMLSSVTLATFSFVSYHFNSKGKVWIATTAGFLCVLLPALVIYSWKKLESLTVPVFVSIIFGVLVYLSAKQSKRYIPTFHRK